MESEAAKGFKTTYINLSFKVHLII